MRTSLLLAALAALTITSCNTQQSSSNQNSARSGSQGAPPSASALLEQMDANKDGQLSENEVQGPLKNDFSKIDLNKDGYISKEELEKAPKPNGKKPPKRNQ